jgi:hypothetical protein
MSSEIEGRIGGLTAQQAVRATRLFYDYLPSDFWEGGRKPPMARIETLSKQVSERAPTDLQPFVQSLLAEDENPARGELCKLLLRQFAADDALRPFVERAVTLAEQPVMAIDPVTIGAILVVLTALSTEVSYSTKESNAGGVVSGKEKQISIKNRAPELIKELVEAVKGLPKSMLESIVK